MSKNKYAVGMDILPTGMCKKVIEFDSEIAAMGALLKKLKAGTSAVLLRERPGDSGYFWVDGSWVKQNVKNWIDANEKRRLERLDYFSPNYAGE